MRGHASDADCAENRQRSDAVGRRTVLRGAGQIGAVGLLGAAAGGTVAGQASGPAPRNLTVTDATATTVTLEWDPLPSDAGFDVDHYQADVTGEVHRGEDSVHFGGVDVEPTTETRVTVATMPAGFQGEASVWAVDPEGERSAIASVPLETPAPTGDGAPPAPSDLELTADGGEVVLSWDPVDADDLAYYELRWIDAAPPDAGRPDTPVRRTVSPDATSATIPRGPTVSIRAVDDGGNRSPAETVRVAPPEPGGDAIESSDFTVTGRSESSPEDRASVTIEPATRSVQIDGTLAVPTPCHQPVHRASFDGRILRVSIATARSDDEEVCPQMVEGVEYEATYELGSVPVGVVVEHPETDFRTAEGSVERPSRPGHPEVVESTGSRATLSWDPVNDDDLSHYVLTWDSLPEGVAVDLPSRPDAPPSGTWKSIPASRSEATIDDLSPGRYLVLLHAVDEDGLRSDLAGGTIRIEGGDGPEPIDGRLPTDVDGDGLYEDVNGNGEADFGDVTFFFEHQDAAAVADSPDFYDFNENGELDFGDVVSLFERV